jgi:hypothetical protein
MVGSVQALANPFDQRFTRTSGTGPPHRAHAEADQPDDPDRMGSAPSPLENQWSSAAVRHYRAAEPSRLGKDVPLYTL